MITTTLNKIRAHRPCRDGWTKLLNTLGKTKAGDEPLDMLTILNSNGLDDALWCMRSVPEHDKTWRLYAVWCARQVQHLMKDPRSIAALDVAERFANGEADQDELDAAGAAARAAAWVSARDAAWDWDAADDAAWAAADAARDAADDTAWVAAWAAADAARDAADAARAAAWANQEAKLREILESCDNAGALVAV